MGSTKNNILMFTGLPDQPEGSKYKAIVWQSDPSSSSDGVSRDKLVPKGPILIEQPYDQERQKMIRPFGLLFDDFAGNLELRVCFGMDYDPGRIASSFIMIRMSRYLNLLSYYSWDKSLKKDDELGPPSMAQVDNCTLLTAPLKDRWSASKQHVWYLDRAEAERKMELKPRDAGLPEPKVWVEQPQWNSASLIVHPTETDRPDVSYLIYPGARYPWFKYVLCLAIFASGAQIYSFPTAYIPYILKGDILGWSKTIVNTEWYGNIGGGRDKALGNPDLSKFAPQPGHLVTYDREKGTHRLYLFRSQGTEYAIVYFYVLLRQDGSLSTITNSIDVHDPVQISGSDKRSSVHFSVVEYDNRAWIFWQVKGQDGQCSFTGVSAPVLDNGIIKNDWKPLSSQSCDSEEVKFFNCVTVPDSFMPTAELPDYQFTHG